MRKNDHPNWRARHAAERLIIDEARVRAMGIRRAAAQIGWTLPLNEPVQIRLVWAVADRRRRDSSGPQPTLDAWIDGLRYGGILLDDHRRIVVRSWCEIADTDDPGVSVEITRA